jgi:GNAT superfamily N-acetyltransferase
MFYSGIGGQADFMRGAVLSPGGKTILVVPSTARDNQVSRIVPLLRAGTGVTLNRGDVHYVVTEYGIAYLHGKNIRERAMSLIAIAHPKFRPWLVEQAKRYCLIHQDQAINSGSRGDYPVSLETVRTTHKGTTIVLRPVKVSDEPLLKDFFYGLSDRSLSFRFASSRRDVPHERLQQFTVIDYTRELAILAVVQDGPREEVVGTGGWFADEAHDTAEVAFAVKDAYQNRGIGTALLDYLRELGSQQGFTAFTADVLAANDAMLHVFKKAGFAISETDGRMHQMRLSLSAEPARAESLA